MANSKLSVYVEDDSTTKALFPNRSTTFWSFFSLRGLGHMVRDCSSAPTPYREKLTPASDKFGDSCDRGANVLGHAMDGKQSGQATPPEYNEAEEELVENTINVNMIHMSMVISQIRN